MLTKRTLSTLGLGLCLLMSGCSGNSNLSEVHGRVTLDGQPLANAFVVFSPTTSGTTSYGKTDENGTYRMMFKDTEPGAWVGENIVRINTGDVGSGGGAGPKERVPVVYNQKSTLKVTVASGDNTFDFDLKSDAGKVVQTVND